MSCLITLGAGTPVPTPERWGTSFLLEIGDDWLMVDCGPGTTYKMYQMGFSCTQVEHLFFTHYHSDHCSDYPCFLMTRFDLSTSLDGDLNVYGPPPLKRITEGLWSSEKGVFWLDVVARTCHPKSVQEHQSRGGTSRRAEPIVHVDELTNGQTIEAKNWQCRAYLVDHAQPYLDSIGFRFESEEGVVAFGGDAEPNYRLVALGRDADVFVINALSDVEGPARVAQEAGAKRLILAHLHHSLTSVALVSNAVEKAKRLYDGLVYWGNDMTRVSW